MSFMKRDTAWPGEFCWNRLMTTDLNKAKEFYSDLFGWESFELDTGTTVYTIFKMGDKSICALMKIPPELEGVVLPNWLSFIAVNDIERMTDKARELGATVEVSALTIKNYGHASIIIDPSGARVGLWQSLQDAEIPALF